MAERISSIKLETPIGSWKWPAGVDLLFQPEINAHNDPTIDEKDPTINAKTGTKKSGYSEGKYGPFRCDNCLHFEKKESGCDNTYVLADSEVKGTSELKIVAPDACCTYFRNKDSKIPTSARLEAAAELPDIEGFDAKTTREITKYLIQFPRKLLHHVKKVIATPELGAVHGRYEKETQDILLNPANFTNNLKFGTHDPADIDAHVLAHELGHGLFHSLSEDEQKEWDGLSGWMKGTKKGQAPPYVEKRPGWTKSISNFTHSKDAKFARIYQQKNPHEDFADNMAYYSTGNQDDIPKTKRDFIEKILK